LRGLDLAQTYVKGARVVINFLRWSQETNEIKDVSFFGFSCENREREQPDIDAILKGAHFFCDWAIRTGFQVHPFGHLEEFRDDPKYRSLYDKLDILRRRKHSRDKITVHVAANYSGLPDHEQGALLDAVKLHGDVEVRAGLKDFKHLLSANVPEMQLVIRTGGEHRLSGFLVNQAAYAELLFLGKPWVDFTKQDFDESIAWYRRQNHKHGK